MVIKLLSCLRLHTLWHWRYPPPHTHTHTLAYMFTVHICQHTYTILCCDVLCCAAVEARSMEQAIDALQSLSVAGEAPAADKHPEK